MIFPDPKSFIGPGGKVPPSRDRWETLGYTTVPVLQNLTGKPWDEVSLAYVMALNPSSIRVSKDGVHLDSREKRITVWLKNDLIRAVEMEVSVPLPAGIKHGAALSDALTHGKDSEQVVWHRDAAAYYADCIAGKYYKIVAGKLVEFPK